MYIIVQFLGIKNLREKQGLNVSTDDDDNALIIRLYIIIELIVSMWKYYNLFIRVKNNIMVMSACIVVF